MDGKPNWTLVVMDWKGTRVVQTFGPFESREAARDYAKLYLPEAKVVPNTPVLRTPQPRG